ncbi:Hemerythrin domain-containing protein [Mycena chlorophos]|uniref:Hemerythrin domain-containing protein n=1 Tax=Mycena chlorophos TaxID=658473 RepID=A0A8H6TH92_MYCCL|nr:Hemerythrin domain-containing protein [Mycena chlorophos]
MPYPFPLIAHPAGDWKNPFENIRIEMALAHNMFIRGTNAIYAQARGIQDAQVKPFVFFCINFFGGLHHHHHIEESLIFPFLDAKLGEGAMGHNVEQHHVFLGKLGELEEHLKAVQAGAEVYRGEKIVEMLDAFTEEMVVHLRDEIDTLEPSRLRAALTEQDLKDLNAQLEKKVLSEVSLVTTLPIGLCCHNKASAPHFPALPAPILWVTKYVLYYMHSDAWAFAPCDKHGTLKPGFGNDA